MADTKTNNTEFSKSIMGYACADVDAYIEEARAKYDELDERNKELSANLRDARERIERLKNEEYAASEVVNEAKQEAELIISKAENEAREILESANATSEKIVSDAEARAVSVINAMNDSCEHIIEAFKEKAAAEREKLREAENNVAAFKESLFAAYKEHIAYIDGILPDMQEESISTASDEELEESAIDLARKKHSKIEE